MWELIQTAVYNTMHKALDGKLEQEKIEERSMDITVRIFSTLNHKRDRGKPWKIGKVSSYVYNACKWRYNETWKMEDRLIYVADVFAIM